MKKIIFRVARFLIQIILPIINFGTIKFDGKNAENELRKIYKNEEEKYIKIHNSENEQGLDLSIIIPVYNSEKLLKSCIDSVMGQKTKYNFEIVAINDGSTDNSLEILKQYSKIKIIDKINEGVAVARNVGLDASKGKYVAFIDSDDKIDENYVEKLLNRAYEKNADIVKCNYVERDVENGQIIKYERHEDVSICDDIGKKIVEFKGFVWGGIFKREIWSDVRFLPQYWYEDMIIRFVLYRKCEQFEYINEDLYIYNNHSSNISKSISKTENIRCLDHLFLVKELLKLSDKLGLKKDVALYKVLLQELGTLLWLRTRDLSKKNKMFAFAMACDIIKKYSVECELQKMEKYLEKAFETKNFLLWKISSVNIMLGVKVGNE